MKKLSLISFIIVSVILMTLNAFALEGPPSVGTPPDYYVESDGTVTMRTELGQLCDIGIMKDVGGGYYGSITRSEMAKIITQMYGLFDIDLYHQNVDFIDVSSRNPYSASIKFVSDSKIMNGYGDGLFLPDKDITYYEAVKTLVTVLGYEPLALQRGGYPQGYLKVANELGIIIYPNADNYAVTKSDITDMVFKAIDTPLMKQSGFGADNQYIIMDGKNGVELQTLRTMLGK